jgi:hypothetical protein
METKPGSGEIMFHDARDGGVHPRLEELRSSHIHFVHGSKIIDFLMLTVVRSSKIIDFLMLTVVRSSKIKGFHMLTGIRSSKIIDFLGLPSVVPPEAISRTEAYRLRGWIRVERVKRA